MKKIHNILAVAAIALTFTACSSDNDTPADSGKEYPISLSVGISDLSVVTRTENTTTPLTSGNLGLYITMNGEKTLEGKYLCNNAKFTYINSGWTCGTTYYWAADNATIDYVAYHPYQLSISGNFISFKLAQPQNAAFPIQVSPFGNIIDSIFEI